jgi:uncharacterized protein (TIGR03437 family)
MGDGVARFNGDGNVGTVTSISEVTGLAVDLQGNLLIADTDNHRIRRWSAVDSRVSSVAGTGAAGHSADGTAAVAALLNRPAALAQHPNGDIYFSDVGNNLIQRIHATLVTTVAGNPNATGRIGPALQVRVTTCIGVVLNAGGTGLYFTEEESDTVRLLDFATQQVSLIAGNGTQGFSGDNGPATLAMLGNPNHIVIEPSGLVVADPLNNRIRRIIPGGTITTIAGGSAVSNGDGGLATQATLKKPISVKVDPKGNLIIADQGSCSIRRVDLSGHISTVAGAAGSCLLGNLGTSIADSAGNLYWATSVGFFVRGPGDPPEGRLRIPLQFVDILLSRDGQRIYLVQNARVWTITPENALSQATATISPFAGLVGGTGGDGGPALANVLFIAESVAEDSQGNVYILDAGNRNIRRVDRTTGKISTAVTSNPFVFALGMTIDPLNNFLVTVANQIARFSPLGVVDSVVGAGPAGLSPDGVDGILSSLNLPYGITSDANGIAYFADYNNNLVRRLTPVTATSLKVVPTKPTNSGSLTAQVVAGASDQAVLGGLAVHFAVTSGTATLSDTATTTNTQGIASVNVSLKSSSAVVTATVTGLPTVDINVTSTGATGIDPSIPIVSSAISLSGYGGSNKIAPGGWVEIHGLNLAADVLQWSDGDFHGGVAPTSLAGVRVQMNGFPAFVEYVSSTQINCVVPDDVAPGDVSIVVLNATGASNPVHVTAAAKVPGLLAPDTFIAGGKQYVVAIFPDQTFAGPVGFVAGATSRPAIPGERITLYGVGFGPTTPFVPSGTIATGLSTVSNVQVFFGDTPVVVEYAGLAGGVVGLYQFNLVVPDGVTGDVRLTVTADGIPSDQVLWVSTK